MNGWRSRDTGEWEIRFPPVPFSPSDLGLAEERKDELDAIRDGLAAEGWRISTFCFDPTGTLIAVLTDAGGGSIGLLSDMDEDLNTIITIPPHLSVAPKPGGAGGRRPSSQSLRDGASLRLISSRSWHAELFIPLCIIISVPT